MRTWRCSVKLKSCASGPYTFAAVNLPFIGPTETNDVQLQDQLRERDEVAKKIGEWKIAYMSKALLHELSGLEWINCHDHVAVNALNAMGVSAGKYASEQMSEARLAELSAMQAGNKQYDPDKNKFHVNVWLKNQPVNHFIYRFTVYLAVHSQKHWARGKSFVELILAFDEQVKHPTGLDDEDDQDGELRDHDPHSDPWEGEDFVEDFRLEQNERFILQGLMAIRGSRNGVFFANAIAILAWRKRAMAFMRREEKLHDADKTGGATRRYLMMMLEEPIIIAALHAMALIYLTFFLPFTAAAHHVADLAEDLPRLDQETWTALVEASDDIEIILNPQDPEAGILPEEFDEGLKRRNYTMRSWVRSEIASLNVGSPAEVEAADHVGALLNNMLADGAVKFHEHTVERQVEARRGHEHDPKLGTALNLTKRRKSKMRGGTSTTQTLERMFGSTRHVHDKAPTLLYLHLRGRTRCTIDKPMQWLKKHVRKGTLSQAAFCRLIDVIAAEGRRRARVAGGFKGQSLRLGRARVARDAAKMAKAREAAEKLAASIEKLRRVRKRKLSGLKGMSNDELLEQIRVFKVVDKVDVTMSKFSTRLSRLECLAELFRAHLGADACDLDQDALEKLAGDRAKPKRRAAGSSAKRKKKEAAFTGDWHVAAIVGAKMTKEGRMYHVHWAGEDEDGVAWDPSWVYYSAIFPEDGTAIDIELAKEIEEIDELSEEEMLALEAGDATFLDLVNTATEGRLRAGDRVLHDTGKSADDGGAGVRPGTVVAIQGDGRVKVKYDAINLDKTTRTKKQGAGPLASKDVVLDKEDGLSLAPPETDIAARDRVRVVQQFQYADESEGTEPRFKWQFGSVYWVHSRLILEVDYEGPEGFEWAKSLPAYAHEVQRCDVPQ